MWIKVLKHYEGLRNVTKVEDLGACMKGNRETSGTKDSHPCPHILLCIIKQIVPLPVVILWKRKGIMYEKASETWKIIQLKCELK